jgi:ribosomal protein S18 acetylase RimI-like enzyme
MKMIITPFTIESYEGTLALWQQTEGIGLDNVCDSKEGIQTYLKRNPGMSFVAIADGKVIGAVLGGHDGRRGYIHHLAVHPNCRWQGIGRKLVQNCLDVFRSAGIRKCHIFIFNDNSEGIEFWKSIGWTPREDISIISNTIEQIDKGDG